MGAKIALRNGFGPEARGERLKWVKWVKSAGVCCLEKIPPSGITTTGVSSGVAGPDVGYHLRPWEAKARFLLEFRVVLPQTVLHTVLGHFLHPKEASGYLRTDWFNDRYRANTSN